eukprot:Sdes_comp20068_c0_seq1m12964
MTMRDISDLSEEFRDLDTDDTEEGSTEVSDSPRANRKAKVTKVKKGRNKKPILSKKNKAAEIAALSNNISPNGAPFPRHIRTGPQKVDLGIKCKDFEILNFDIGFQGHELINGGNVKFVFGHRYGLIGRNGIGKSTFMNEISRLELPIPAHIRLMHVEQEVVGDDTTAIDSVVNSDEELVWLRAEEDYLVSTGKEDSQEMIDVHARLHEIESDSAVARASKILSGLGFDEKMQNMKTREFSGGWRMRISIAQALYCEPDLLLLDEPSNHLDVEASVWLEAYLKNWKKILLITSHERQFLNSVCTDIYHLHRKKLWHYRGNYDTFSKARSERQRHLLVAQKTQEAMKSHLKAYIAKNQMGYSNLAKQAQCRMKMLKKLESNEIEVDMDDPSIQFNFPDPEPLPPPCLTFTNVSFGYGDEPNLFEKLNFGVDLDSRIAIVGANGVGKSTLMKILYDEMVPREGYVAKNPKCRVAYFNQHHIEALDLTKSPLQHFRSKYPDASEQVLRAYLGRFGLGQTLGIMPIKNLSGGQKSRVTFADMAYKNPHIMLLDEPSNHLDLETIESLSLSLNIYEGGVVLISHDERLIDLVCDEIWVVKDKTVTIWNGTFHSYKKHLAEEMGLDIDDWDQDYD